MGINNMKGYLVFLDSPLYRPVEQEYSTLKIRQILVF